MEFYFFHQQKSSSESVEDYPFQPLSGILSIKAALATVNQRSQPERICTIKARMKEALVCKQACDKWVLLRSFPISIIIFWLKITFYATLAVAVVARVAFHLALSRMKSFSGKLPSRSAILRDLKCHEGFERLTQGCGRPGGWGREFKGDSRTIFDGTFL